ncbi:hypothetical protein [Hoyosella altamirensis]|uniref:Uncharacterized protein n=1 Tax=Hoyosella altamirensis TaxID=616997 RepID=A0A839RK46_9ACTN|nr:hypothetical protein [Hoyosella altamirensis]MBB3036777.1 hypothetical protein [Hoyosella altamirensis]
MSLVELEESVPQGTSTAWPGLLRVRPRSIVALTVAALGLAWLAVALIDVAGLVDISGDVPLWLSLFNEGIVEVTQWILNALAVVAASYIAGRLAGGRYAGGASFFFVLSIGLALILIEEAGNVRLAMAEYLGAMFGGQILGMHPHVVGAVPVYAVLAFFPVYALLRYGKYVWRAPTARWYLVIAYCLYGGSQLAALTSHLAGVWYAKAGSAVNELIFGGGLPALPNVHQGVTDYFIVDSLVEETIELLAVATMLAMILAYIHDLRRGAVSAGQSPNRD